MPGRRRGQHPARGRIVQAHLSQHRASLADAITDTSPRT
jgi:hypothetical protein